MEPKPAKKPVRLAKHTVDITQCIQGDEFVDGKGKRHSKERQMRRIRKWVKSCWFKARKKGERGSSVLFRLRSLWAKHGTQPFSSSELQFRNEAGRMRYPSARGFCDGHEVSGFPVLVPLTISAKGIIKMVKFYPLLCKVLSEHRAIATANVVAAIADAGGACSVSVSVGSGGGGGAAGVGGGGAVVGVGGSTSGDGSSPKAPELPINC